jgi:hypothetical protein
MVAAGVTKLLIEQEERKNRRKTGRVNFIG